MNPYLWRTDEIYLVHSSPYAHTHTERQTDRHDASKWLAQPEDEHFLHLGSYVIFASYVCLLILLLTHITWRKMDLPDRGKCLFLSVPLGWLQRVVLTGRHSHEVPSLGSLYL